MTMADLLRGLFSSRKTDDNDDGLNDIRKMAMLSQVDPSTAIGYQLGQYLGNYLDRGQERDAQNALKSDTELSGKIAQNTINNVVTGQKLSDSINSFNALNPNQSGNSLASTAKKLVDETQQPLSTWEQMATKYGDVSTNGLLSGLDKTVNKTAQTAGVNATSDTATGGNSLGGTIGGINSIDKLSNGQGSILDVANLGKLFGFFDNAASGSDSGAAKNNDVPLEEAVKQLVPENQNLSQAQRLALSKIQNDIIQTKIAYAQAQAGGNELGMQQAHHQAESIRKIAQDMGFNLSSLNSDSTVQDAIVRKNEDDYREKIKRLVSPELTTQEYYDQTYNKLRDMGYGYDIANRVAAQKSQSYQAQRISALSNQLQMQGIGQSGAINDIGAQILTQLQNESPQAYEALAKMYAMPRDDYAFNNAIKQAVANEGLQKDLATHNSGLRMGEADQNLVRTKDLNAYDNNLAKDRMQFGAGLDIQKKAALDQITLNTQGMAMQQRYAIMYNSARQLGLSDQEARTYALGVAGGNNKAMSQQMSNQLSAAKAIIADHDNFVKNNMDPKAKYPNEEQYQQAIKLYGSILSGNQGNSSGQGYNLNNYEDAVKDATDLLSQATQRGGYSKQQLINGFKNRYGDMADDIVNSIDWSQWGY